MIDPNSSTYLRYCKMFIKFVLETLEDQCMLRCLQLFHQQPTLTDISIPPNTQV